MTQTVHKYVLSHLTPGTPEAIHVPFGATPLHFAAQDGRPVMWCLVDVEEHRLDTDRRFLIVGTGHRMPVAAVHHIGTILTAGGALVWHLFEVGGPGR